MQLESFSLIDRPLQRAYGLRAVVTLAVPAAVDPDIRDRAEALAFKPFREQAAEKFRQSVAASRLAAKRDALAKVYDSLRDIDLGDPAQQSQLTNLKRQVATLEKELHEATQAAKDELKRLAAGPRDLVNDLQRRMGEVQARIQAVLPADMLQELFALALAGQLAYSQSTMAAQIADLLGDDPEAPAGLPAGPERRPTMGMGSLLGPGIGAFAAK